VIEAGGIDQLAQHVVVFIVALMAAVVVARRVFGVFERPSGGSTPPGPAAPGCSHCAAGKTRPR
jgi:hypothetical protein